MLVQHSSACACALAVSYLTSLSERWRNRKLKQKLYCIILATESDHKMCQENERCFPRAPLWQMCIVRKLAAGSCRVFLPTKHSFQLSPTPNTWLPTPFLIKPINRWWHDTCSVVKKEKNEYPCFINTVWGGNEAALFTEINSTVPSWI